MTCLTQTYKSSIKLNKKVTLHETKHELTHHRRLRAPRVVIQAISVHGKVLLHRTERILVLADWLVPAVAMVMPTAADTDTGH